MAVDRDPEVDRWKRIQSLFHATAELPESERDTFLRAECGTDHALCEQVRAMLAADSGDAGLLDEGLAGAAGRVLGEMDGGIEGRAFSPYRITGLLGEGGMGVVYRAHRADISGDAAIKLLRDAAISPARRERFQFEQRALAQLNHPSIARIYDAGTLADGAPWFAMELVDGVPITEYCDGRGLSVEARLKLFRAVCEAVSHAHSRAILHRDLKPSNILVTADGQVKLLDFGIAKSLEALADPGDATRTGLRLMTPAYAAPEQILGGPLGVHTDVYALGVVLYEILAGRLPFDLAAHTPSEVVHVITQQTPRRPSTAAGETRPPGLSGTGRAAWNDLDVLCLTAMHREPGRRYRTVDALLGDVDRFLSDEPLEARGDSMAYRAGKFLRRHAWAAATVAAAVVLLATTVTFYTVRLRTSRDAVLAEAARTQRVQGLIHRLFTGWDDTASPADTLRVITLVERGIEESRSLSSEPALRAELERTLGIILLGLGEYDRADSMLTGANEHTLQAARPPDAEVARNLIALSSLRRQQSRFSEADSLARRALGHAVQRLGSRDPVVDEAMLAAGNALGASGDYAEALPLIQEVVRRRAASGEASAELAQAMTAELMVHQYLGQWREADSLGARVLAMSRELHGDRHPNVAHDLINAGVRLLQRGRTEEAERQFLDAVDILRGHFGEDHPETASGLAYLGRALIHQGRYHEAEPVLRSAQTIFEGHYGPRHIRTAQIWNEMGGLELHRERYAEAAAIFSRVLEAYREIYGREHYAVGVMLANLGDAYMRDGDLAQAVARFSEALDVYEAVIPPGHVDVGITNVKLGRTLLRRKSYAEAERATRAAYDILLPQVDPGSGFLRAARTDLVAEYEALGRPEEAARFRAELADTSGGR